MQVSFSTKVKGGLNVDVEATFYNGELDELVLFVKSGKRYRRAQWLERSLSANDNEQLSNEAYEAMWEAKQ